MTTADHPPPAEPMAIDGLINFRDIGGVATADGRRVQAGLVYRSDSLDRLSQHALDQLAELGIGQVIDLRSTEEVEAHGRIEIGGIEWKHRSLGAAPSEMKQLVESGRDPMVANYELMTTDYADELVSVLRDVADAATPTVLHCTSGKDRTGVVAALIQLCLGVAREVVVAEYSASRRNVADHLQMMASKYPDMAARVPAEQRLRMAGTDPHWLATALAPVEAAGGTDRWMHQHSGSDTLATSLRRRLLAA